MANLSKDGEDIIELDEDSEGNSVGSSDFIFRKIGSSIPLKLADAEFDLRNPPVQALAVSERFRVAFLAHSEGFYVAKMKDIIELAKEMKEKGKSSRSIQDLCVMDVQIGRVSILAVSADSLTLAACVGGKIDFFSIDLLLNKEKALSFSCSIGDSGDSGFVRDLRWNKNAKNSFIVLSSHGMLYRGDLGGPLKDVLDAVDAVDWSTKGDLIAVARKNTLSIVSFEFMEKWVNVDDEKYLMKVDSIKWVRPDSIIVGSYKLTEDGGEDGYIVQVITHNGCEITEASSKRKVLSFGDLFASVVDDIVPFGGGPYLYAEYLERWGLMLAANRKNTDQHVVLLGWSLGDEQGEVVAVEFEQEKDIPRIELSESGDDNLMVGFGIDRVSLYEKVEFVKKDGERGELSPYCVLLCLTSDGNLTMFHVARVSDTALLLQAPSMPPGDNITSEAEDSSAVIPVRSAMKDNGVDAAAVDGKSRQMNEQMAKGVGTSWENDFQVTEMKDLDSKSRQMNETVDGGDRIFKENASRVTEQKGSLQTSSVANQMFTTGSMSAFTHHDSLSTSASKELISLVNIQKSEVDVQNSDKSSTSQHDYKGSLKSNKVGKGFAEMTGASGFGNTSSASQSSGILSFSNEFSSRSSSFSSSAPSHSDGHTGVGISTGNSSHVPANQAVSSSTQSSTKMLMPKASGASPSASVFSSGKATQSEGPRIAFTGAQSAYSTPGIHGLRNLSQEESILQKSVNSTANHMLDYEKTKLFSGAVESGQELSKSHISASEMAKELDGLLLEIEKEGGFRDVCTVFQKNSVLELEKGLENLSERCSLWKNTLDERLGDIEHLRDKTVQVLARKIYIESIVMQASNSQYWELWNRQKLNPEFELKRQKILQLNQNLMNQIIELERHFNALELNKFGDSNRVPTGRRTFHSNSEPPRQIQSLHSLYNTMNSQLAAAEKLSDCFSKQMAMLNIEPPHMKKLNVAKELFESIGLPYDGASSHSPYVRKVADTPESTKKLPPPSFSAINEQSRKNASSALKGIEPETARRRRDSLDRSWGSFEPQKTTVKRMLLEESSRVSKNKSAFGINKQAFNSQLEEGFSTIIEKDHTASVFSSLPVSVNKQQPRMYLSNKDMQGKPSTQAFESHSAALFKWAKDSTGAPQAGGSKSPPRLVMQKGNLQLPTLASTPSSQDALQNSKKETLDSAGRSIFGSTHVGHFDPPTVQAVSLSETRSNVQSDTPNQTLSRNDSILASTKTGFPKKTVNVKAQEFQPSNWKSGENVLAKQMTGSTKHASVTPESRFAAPEKVRSSPFASASAVPPAGLSGKSFQFDTPLSRTQLTEATSTPTLSASSPISTPAFAPPIQPSFSLNPVSVAPSKSSSPVSTAPPSPPSAMSNASLSSSATLPANAFQGALPNMETNKTPASLSSSSASASFSSTPCFSSETVSFQLEKLLASSLLDSCPEISKPKVASAEQAPPSQPKAAVNEQAPPSQPKAAVSEQVPPSRPKSAAGEQAPPSQPKAAVDEQAPPQPIAAAVEFSSGSEPAQSLATAGEVPAGSSAGRQDIPVISASTFNVFGAASNIPLNSQVQNSSAACVPFSTMPLNTTAEPKKESVDVGVTQEDEMEEEAADTTEIILGALGGFGLESNPAPTAAKPNPFGAPFGSSVSNPSSPPFAMTVPNGELLRPASFTFPSATPQASQPMNQGAFSGGFGNIATSSLTGSGFGQPAQIGAGQQGLGSVLGAFGQSRQLGPGLPGFGAASASNFGSGFSAAARTGFAGAATGGGFAGVASTAGGFAGVASGGGFATVASAGGGFAGAAAAAGGGFAAAAAGGGGFGGAVSGGFGAFSNQQGSGGFAAFGGGNAMGTGKPQELFTQMRR